MLLPNATTGLNAVISSVALAPGDTLYMLDIGYGSVKKMLSEAAGRAGAAVVLGQVGLPVRWVGVGGSAAAQQFGSAAGQQGSRAAGQR